MTTVTPELLERERASVEKLGPRAVRAAVVRLRSECMRSRRPGAVARSFAGRLAPVVLKMLVAAHLVGRRRGLLTAQAARPQLKMSMSVDALKEAVRFVKARAGLTAGQYALLESLYSEQALKAAKGFSDAVERQVLAAVEESVVTGAHARRGRQLVGQALTDAGADADGHLVETLFRTQASLAYMAGRLNADKDEAVQEILWGYEYATVGDDRVRPSHAALDGTRLPKEDPLWRTIMPPNGYNCRCTVMEVFDEGSRREPGRGAGPDAGWEFNPGELFRDTLK